MNSVKNTMHWVGFQDRLCRAMHISWSFGRP